MRYISEEELRKWLITDGCEKGHGYIDEDDFACMDWQDNPIKTGHWIPVYLVYGISIDGEEQSSIVRYKCSKCKKERHEAKTMYCPNCGARMIESEEV